MIPPGYKYNPASGQWVKNKKTASAVPSSPSVVKAAAAVAEDDSTQTVATEHLEENSNSSISSNDSDSDDNNNGAAPAAETKRKQKQNLFLHYNNDDEVPLVEEEEEEVRNKFKRNARDSVVSMKKNSNTYDADTTVSAYDFDDDDISPVEMNDEVEYNTKTKQRLIEFYMKYNPGRVATVDVTLKKYKGRENELFRKLETKYVKKDVAKKKKHDADDDSDDDDDDVMDAPMSLQMQMRLNAQKKAKTKRGNSHGVMTQDSMKLIPTFNDDDDDDDDDDEGETDEVTALTNSLRDLMILNQANSDTKIRRCLSENDLKEERVISFGVRLNDTSTTQLKDTSATTDADNLSKPMVLERQSSAVSFSETVTLNHVDSFKDLLSLQEQEDIWYTDVEMVIMKVDCGLFNKAAQNQQTKRKQEIAEHRRRKSTGGIDTNSSAAAARAASVTAKAQERKAKEMRKKYGIDKKVKQLGKDNTTATAVASATVAATADATPKKKRKGLSFFGKKKK